MSRVHDIWIRAVVESEKAKETPGFNPEVYVNIQFLQMVDREPVEFSNEQWRKFIEAYIQKEGVRVPEQGLDRKQKVSVTCRQLDGELYQGKVEIPTEYTGENPDYSVKQIY